MDEPPVFPVLGSHLTRDVVGGKASVLSELAQAGFPVPAGFVVTGAALGMPPGELTAALAASAATIGGGPFAVRSSAVAEDLADASFAGLYETFLGVAPADLENAVRRCFDSAAAERVSSYAHAVAARLEHSGRGENAHRMAVLVQQMLQPRAAGVAFTAHPLTGSRDEIVITATRGLADGLVSGTDVGEEWIFKDGALRRSRGHGVLTETDAASVAALARDIGGHFGAPQDIEWAVLPDGGIRVLQARPMTAVPDPVEWTPPGPGVWLRNLRLGEWLPEPVTPLFMDWVMRRINEGYDAAVKAAARTAIPIGHATVNGWYYVRLSGPAFWLLLPLRVRPRQAKFVYDVLFRALRDPAGAHRSALRALEEKWRADCLPNYRKLARAAGAEVDSASFNALMRWVDELAATAGEYLW